MSVCVVVRADLVAVVFVPFVLLVRSLDVVPSCVLFVVVAVVVCVGISIGLLYTNSRLSLAPSAWLDLVLLPLLHSELYFSQSYRSLSTIP